MGQFGQSRDNVFYMECTERSAPRDRYNPVNNRLDPDLPQSNLSRWTPRRKAAVVIAIHQRIISVWDACERYDLSAAELAEWERDLDRHGIAGLRVTKIQIYRKMPA